MNRRMVLVFMVAILVVSATFSVANAQVTREKHSVPFKANLAATATPAGPPVGSILEIFVSGSGQTSHMGNAIVWEHMFVNLATGEFYDGEYVLTAANGDEVEGSFHGYMVPTSVPGDMEIVGFFTIDDGTGRFEGAQGEGTASGMQYADYTVDLRLDGTITSVGFKK